MSNKEIPLTEGNTSLNVVRVGDTVRKHTTKHSSTVHRLLHHVSERGFTKCPRFLGIDELGRETLSFIPGETGMPDFIWTSDECLARTATILRQYHDASSDFSRCKDDCWSFEYRVKNSDDVICHNDFAPYNTVYENQLPIGIIDFDLAGVGPRLRDVAYAAYWNVPLSVSDKEMQSFARIDLENDCVRLRLFCESYGIVLDDALLEMVQEVLEHMGSEQAAISMIGEVATCKLKDGGHLEHWRKEAEAFLLHKAKVLDVLQSS